MVKSSTGAAKMRRSNRRIQFQELAIRETQARAYESRSLKADRPEAFSWLFTVAAAIRDFARGFFRNPIRAIGSLNLLHKMDMGPQQHRGVGAAKLREWFPGLGRMVSTRDGKWV